MNATGLRYLPWYPMAGGNGESDPPAADPPSSDPPSGEPGGDRAERQFSRAELAAAVQDALRREREKSEAAQKKVAEDAESKRLAEQQQWKELAEKEQAKARDLEARAAAHEAHRRRLALEYETQLQAVHLGVVDADAAYRLLDVSQVQYDADDKPTNLPALLQALIEARPWLKGPANGPTGVPATPRPSTQTETPAQRVERMAQRLASSGAYDRL